MATTAAAMNVSDALLNDTAAGAASKPAGGSATIDTSVKTFSAPDYVVFAISLALPLVVGVFFFVWDLKKGSSSAQNFLMGERKINFVVVALSLLASVINGIFVIGVPAEVHYYGVRYALIVVGIFVCVVVVSLVFAPKYHDMNFTSAYEYVDRRFNYATRVIASLIFTLSVCIFLAVVLYVPALAFAQVTELNIFVTIFITGAICTIYTTIGGIKAVVWTDSIQMVILLVGLIAIAALGSQKVGGSAEVWRIAKESGRVNFEKWEFYSPDPRTRHTLWTQIFGQLVTYLGLFIGNQMMVQRYMAVSSRVQAQLTLYVLFILFVPLAILIVFIGLALHAAYWNCEPLIKGTIESGDRIFPHYIMDLLGEHKGVPGLLTAAVFAAALSSVSSVSNSLSATWLEDFIVPGYRRFSQKTMTERQKRFTAIGLVLFFGILSIGLSFLASSFTSKLVQATGTIWGVLGGPLGGIFVMGFFLPFVNSAGAIGGMIGGLAFTLWISIAAIVHVDKPAPLPLIPPMPWNYTGCISTAKFYALVAASKAPTTPAPDFPLLDLYKVSYAWYGVIGMGSCIIIGTIISLATICFEKCRPRLNKELMCLCCCESIVLNSSQIYEVNKEQTIEAYGDNDDANVKKIKTSSGDEVARDMRYDNSAYTDEDQYSG